MIATPILGRYQADIRTLPMTYVITIIDVNFEEYFGDRSRLKYFQISIPSVSNFTHVYCVSSSTPSNPLVSSSTPHPPCR